MKNIKLIFISATICALLASCGMNTARNNANTNTINNSPKPTATAANNVSDTNNGKIEEDNKTGNMADTAGNAVNDASDAAGNIVRDAGDAVGDAADSVGDMAKNAVDGAGDAVGMNDANGNGR